MHSDEQKVMAPSAQQTESQRTIDMGYDTVAENEKVNRVRKIFNRVAKKYDVLNDLLSLGMHRLWKRYTIRQMQLTSDMKVLDIASGTCDLPIRMSRLTDSENVTATDINAEMLTVGERRLRERNLKCPVVISDAEALPFADNTFDAVTVSFGIRNMTHKDRALREMYRVLRPGGRLYVLEFSQCQRWVKPFYDFYSFKFMPWIAGVIANDAASYRYLAESIRMHPNQPAFANLMKGENFDGVKWKNLTFGICALHMGTKPLPGAK